MKQHIGKIKSALLAGTVLCALGGMLFLGTNSVPHSAFAAETDHTWEHETEGTILSQNNIMETLSGKYYLSEDLVLDDTLYLTGEVELCLNGFQFTIGENGSLSVDVGGSLTIYDCEQGECQQHTGEEAHKGEITGATEAAITVYNDGSLTLNGGSITGNTSSFMSAGVSLHDNATFTMNGGKIISNTVTDGKGGGGVYVRGGTFIMNGGEISNNTVSVAPDPEGDAYVGGGAIFAEHGIVQINGGVISGNQATNGYGGGILLRATEEYYGQQQTSEPASITFSMSGDALIANNSAVNGGGIAMIGGVTATMSGGTIGGYAYADGQTVDGNRATSNNEDVGDGGVYLLGTTLTYGNEQTTANLYPTFTMTGGVIGYTVEEGASVTEENNPSLGNSAGFGGGVFVSEHATFTLGGEGIVGYSVTPEQYEDTDPSTMLPYGNKATPSGYNPGGGGGVSVWSDGALFRMTGGKVLYNSDSGRQSGISVRNNSNMVPDTYAAFEGSGGTISCSTIGVYCTSGGTARLSGTVSLKTCRLGVNLYSGGIFEMSGGTISECNVGVAVENMMSNYHSAITLTGGSITGNEMGISATAEQNTLGGAPVVKDNLSNGAPQNFLLRSGTLTLLEDFSGGDVGITLSVKREPFTSGYREGMEDFLTLDGIDEESTARIAPAKTWVPDETMQPVVGLELALVYHIDFMDGERTIAALSGNYIAGSSFIDSVLYDPQEYALTDDVLHALKKEPDSNYHYTFASFCDEEGTPYPNLQNERVTGDGVVLLQYTQEEHLFDDWFETENTTLSRDCSACSYRETIADERASFQDFFDSFDGVTGSDSDMLNGELDRFRELGEGEKKFLDEKAQEEGYSGYEGMVDDLICKAEYEAEREDTLETLGTVLRGCDGARVRQELHETIVTMEDAEYERQFEDDYRLEYLRGQKDALQKAVRALERIRTVERIRARFEGYLEEKRASGRYTEEALAEMERILLEENVLLDAVPIEEDGTEGRLTAILNDGLEKLNGIHAMSVASSVPPDTTLGNELYGYLERDGGFGGESELHLVLHPVEEENADMIALFGVSVQLSGEELTGEATVTLQLPEDMREYSRYRVRVNGEVYEARKENDMLVFDLNLDGVKPLSTVREISVTVLADKTVDLLWLVVLLGCICALETAALLYLVGYMKKYRLFSFSGLLAVTVLPAFGIPVAIALGALALLEAVAIAVLLSVIRKKEK